MFSQENMIFILHFEYRIYLRPQLAHYLSLFMLINFYAFNIKVCRLLLQHNEKA